MKDFSFQRLGSRGVDFRVEIEVEVEPSNRSYFICGKSVEYWLSWCSADNNSIDAESSDHERAFNQ